MACKSMNILISGVGSTTSISVIKGLRLQKEYNVNIIGMDINDKENIAGSIFCDKFYKIPPAVEEKSYIDELVHIIETESVDLLIPIIDIELEVIAKYRNKIEKLTYLLLSQYDTILVCNDKIRTFEFFNETGVPTPKTILFDGIMDLKQKIEEHVLKFPLIAKPRKGVSSRDIYRINNEEDFSLIKRVKEPIIQEEVYGKEYTIDVLCDGKNLITAVPRIRLETRAGISYKGETRNDPLIIKYTKIIMEELGIIGPANLQCFKNGDGLNFIEINPRFSGGLPLTIASGINTPLLALKMAEGYSLEPLKNFKICKMCRYWEEVFYYEN